MPSLAIVLWVADCCLSYWGGRVHPHSSYESLDMTLARGRCCLSVVNFCQCKWSQCLYTWCSVEKIIVLSTLKRKNYFVILCGLRGRFLDKRHTGILKCCNLGEKAVKTEGPVFLPITDSGGPRVKYAARCWVNPPGWYPEGLLSPESHADNTLWGRWSFPAPSAWPAHSETTASHLWDLWEGRATLTNCPHLHRSPKYLYPGNYRPWHLQRFSVPLDQLGKAAGLRAPARQELCSHHTSAPWIGRMTEQEDGQPHWPSIHSLRRNKRGEHSVV